MNTLTYLEVTEPSRGSLLWLELKIKETHHIHMVLIDIAHGPACLKTSFKGIDDSHLQFAPPLCLFLLFLV